MIINFHAEQKTQVLFLESSKNIGGQELQLLQQMLELNKLGYETKLLCKPGSRVYDFAISHGLNVALIGFRNALHLPSIFGVIRQILTFRPATLICHSGHDAIVGSLTARLIGFFGVKPKVIRMRTYQPGIPSSFAYNYLFDKTYTPSKHLREKILANKNIQDDRIGVLYPGIDFSKLDTVSSDLPDHLSQWLSDRPGPIICHGAMLRGEKGHTVILRALPEVIQHVPDILYVIAGEGPEESNLKRLVAELNLEDHVYFSGMVSPIAPLLKISALAILPSLMEPLGMFQIESQYLEVPTIASDVDGIPETLIHQETGLLVAAGDVSAWAQNIIWALANKEVMKSWAKAGKIYVGDKFSMANNTKELVNIINSEISR
jgi:glycosyltransferase involved in cell wall biosynthesis